MDSSSMVMVKFLLFHIPSQAALGHFCLKINVYYNIWT